MVEVAEAHVAADDGAVGGHGVAEKRLKAGVADGCHAGVLVAGDVAALVGVGGVGPGDLDLGGQAHVVRGGGHAQLPRAALDLPVAGLVVEVAEGLVAELDGDDLTLARLERHAGKALELLLWAEDLVVGLGDVELDDLGAGDGAGVGDREGGVPLAGLEVAVGKRGVGQAVAKRIGHGLLGRLEVAIAHVEALAVLGALLVGGEGGGGGHVLEAQRPGLRQLAGGVDLATDDVQRGAGAGLAAQGAVEDGAGVVGPVGLHAGAGGEEYDHVGVDLGHRVRELHLVLVELHVEAVGALGLGDLVKGQGEKYDVGVARELQGGVALAGVLAAVALEARLVAHEGEVGLADHVQQGVHLGGVDGRGAGALVARGMGKVADEGDLGARGKRQQRGAAGDRLVLEQDGACRGGLAGQLVVDVLGKGLGCGKRGRVDGERQVDDLVHARVDVLLAEGAGGHGVQELADGAQAGGGHLEGGAGRHSGGVVVGAAPVGDDGAVKAPLLAQDVVQQVRVLVGVGAVDEVVGAHDGLGLRLAHHDLKGREVDLAQRALVQDGVGRLAAGLLAVDGKMLGARGDAVGLDAAHIAGRHLAGKVRVLREVLEVAAAQRIALDAQAWSQKDVHALAGGLLAHGGADALAQLGVPAVGDGDGGGEAGRGLGPVEAQVVGGASLVADAVGAVGELDGRDVGALDAPAAEGGAALEQGALLLKAELADDVLVFHGSSFLRYTTALMIDGGRPRAAILSQSALQRTRLAARPAGGRRSKQKGAPARSASRRGAM